MNTKRVCIKVDSLRKEYNDKTMNLEKWMQDSNNVYVGRHGRIFINGNVFNYRASKWKNIFKKGNSEESYKYCINSYRDYIKYCINENPNIYNIEELRGKNLGCWCPIGQKCHVDVLLELLEN